MINLRITPELIKEEETAAEDREGIWLYVFSLVRCNSCTERGRERERERERERDIARANRGRRDGVLGETILG